MVGPYNEIIRGMNYVSPLATMKFNGRRADEIIDIYFPLGTQSKGQISLVTDYEVKPDPYIETGTFFYDKN